MLNADRVVIGAESEKAVEIMKKVYRVLYLNETPFLTTNLETAELIKYASNAFLDAKISFINELSELCEKVHADIQQISKGMSMYGRIGSKFLHAGPGMVEAKTRLKAIEGSIILYAADEYEACTGADALIIITEWNQFRSMNLSTINASMKGKYFFDLRNIYPKEFVSEKGFEYISVGR